jgi:hypothetical protein
VDVLVSIIILPSRLRCRPALAETDETSKRAGAMRQRDQLGCSGHDFSGLDVSGQNDRVSAR